MTGKPRIAVVAVTYASDEVLPGLLESVSTYEPDVRVVVVDNASPGGPPSVGDAELVEMDMNRGYGAGCNAGVRQLQEDPPEYVVFLNPDIRLLGSSLTELARQIIARPKVGIATGPVISAHGDPAPSAWGRTSAFRAFWFASGAKSVRARRLVGSVLQKGVFASGASMAQREMQVDGFVLGGAMMIRWECFQELGGFDEDFFLAWDDADICHRARAIGWEVWLLPCQPFVHLSGESSRDSAEMDWWEWYVDGAEVFARKHLNGRAGIALLGALKAGRRVRKLKDRLVGSRIDRYSEVAD